VSLKEQLEESHQTNEALTNDLQKLSSEWDSLREEMTLKEEEWKEEEMAFNEYYSSEHNRLLNLWRDVVSVKRLFSEMKFATERDLTKLRGEMNGVANDTLTACSSTSFFLKLQAASSMLPSQQANRVQLANEGELQSMKEGFEAAKSDIRSKEQRIQQLTREVRHSSSARPSPTAYIVPAPCKRLCDKPPVGARSRRWRRSARRRKAARVRGCASRRTWTSCSRLCVTLPTP
jgi:rootletin